VQGDRHLWGCCRLDKRWCLPGPTHSARSVRARDSQPRFPGTPGALAHEVHHLLPWPSPDNSGASHVDAEQPLPRCHFPAPRAAASHEVRNLLPWPSPDNSGASYVDAEQALRVATSRQSGRQPRMRYVVCCWAALSPTTRALCAPAKQARPNLMRAHSPRQPGRRLRPRYATVALTRSPPGTPGISPLCACDCCQASITLLRLAYTREAATSRCRRSSDRSPRITPD
jgi:hypothetical protein